MISHADIPDEMDTATRYEGSTPYACTIDITIGMRFGLLRLGEIVPPEHLDRGERSFIDYVSKRDMNIMSNFDGGQIMFSFLIGDKTLLWSAHLGAYRGILEHLEPKPGSYSSPSSSSITDFERYSYPGDRWSCEHRWETL